MVDHEFPKWLNKLVHKIALGADAQATDPTPDEWCLGCRKWDKLRKGDWGGTLRKGDWSGTSVEVESESSEGKRQRVDQDRKTEASKVSFTVRVPPPPPPAPSGPLNDRFEVKYRPVPAHASP